MLFQKDPSLLFEYDPSNGFHCGEEEETVVDNDYDHGGGSVVSFWCTIPLHEKEGEIDNNNNNSNYSNNNHQKLTFSCRDKSVGVLLDEEKKTGVATVVKEDGNNEVQEDDDDDDVLVAVDPNFFDSGYTLAGKTGFQIWAGSRLLIESLVVTQQQQQIPPSSSLFSAAPPAGLAHVLHPRLVEWQRRISQQGGPCKVIELGAGVGIVGMSLAACGAEVLLTDLPTLVDNSIKPNLVRNKSCAINNANNNNESSRIDSDEQQASGSAVNHDCPPKWLTSTSSSAAETDPVPIGRGWANATALDWTRPVHEQLSTSQLEGVDLIVASDCVWLTSMLDSLLDTVESIFSYAAPADASNSTTTRPLPPPRSRSFLMSFQRRDSSSSSQSGSSGSGMFTTVDMIIDTIKRKRMWNIDCLAWRPITLLSTNNDDTTTTTETKEVFVFEITTGK